MHVQSVYKCTRFLHACIELPGLYIEKQILLHEEILNSLFQYLDSKVHDHTKFLFWVYKYTRCLCAYRYIFFTNIPGFYMYV